ncbi:uncharacterized protein LOC130712695 [Lotus japonicus]|uniref:uncharacterized protein LOC130712695 n=1 Tax=Lotus japonicus TaxID=34305 RepID=UPI00258FC6D8|nr:uncharacterized protein LOC130712695 [Lotus japonicus]
MASRIDDLAKVDASKETWTIVAKVSHLWLSPSLYGSKLPFSLDMILMDGKGCKIHATVRKTLIYRFQSSLTEGKVYQISYFGVGESGRDFRLTEHPFKINFDIQTSVRLLPNKAINITTYSFVPLADIMYKDLDTSFLIDVIGILTGESGEQEFEKDGTKQKRITIELDQDGSPLARLSVDMAPVDCLDSADLRAQRGSAGRMRTPSGVSLGNRCVLLLDPCTTKIVSP